VQRLSWGDGSWWNTPAEVEVLGEDLLVTAVGGSDLWRPTAYGFVHDNAHGLLRSFSEGTAIEVSFLVDYAEQFDQAGVLVRADPARWLKAGVEISDGEA
jgi:regulation of enolase protein 1 (concanavalin A-like superfamily)